MIWGQREMVEIWGSKDSRVYNGCQAFRGYLVLRAPWDPKDQPGLLPHSPDHKAPPGLLVPSRDLQDLPDPPDPPNHTGPTGPAGSQGPAGAASTVSGHAAPAGPTEAQEPA